MAQKPNITKLYDKIFTVKEMLTDCVNTIMEAANDAEAFGGEVSRVITGQLRQSLLPELQRFVDDESNPASMIAMIKFLDSVPLAWVRTGPEQEPGMTPGADIINPAEGPGMEMGQGMPAGNPTAPAPGVNPTAPDQPVDEQAMLSRRESAILKNKGKALREHLKEDWKANHEEQPIEEGKLDFRNFKEGFVRDSVPSQLEADSADKVYNSILERKSKASKTERLDEDFIAGPYAVEENVGGMKDWRKMVDNTDDKIDSAMRG